MFSASPVRQSHLLEEYTDVQVAETNSPSRCSSQTSVDNGIIWPDPDPYEVIAPFPNVDASGDNAIRNDLAGLSQAAATPTQLPTLWKKLTANRYDVVLLSLTIQILYSLSPFSYDVYFFLPLAVYVLMKHLWSPANLQPSIINALLLLQGISPAKVQTIVAITQIVSVFVQDVSVFLFTTICVQSLVVTLQEMQIT